MKKLTIITVILLGLIIVAMVPAVQTFSGDYFQKGFWKFMNVPKIATSNGTVTDTLESRSHARGLWTNTSIRSLVSTSATGLNYNAGVISLAIGYAIPTNSQLSGYVTTTQFNAYKADTIPLPTALRQLTVLPIRAINNTARDLITGKQAGDVIISTTDVALEYWNGSSWIILK